jgi:hypothetical protein
MLWNCPPRLERNNQRNIGSAAEKQLMLPEIFCRTYPSQISGLLEEVEGAKEMLNGLTFYTTITNEECMAVLSAMAREFQGTGHWYYCQNGHPFTIGECGGAMQLSSCPECSTPVGGQSHWTVTGVRPAGDLEQALGRMTL